MQGNVQDTRILFKHSLDTVAVVYIPIDNKDSAWIESYLIIKKTNN